MFKIERMSWEYIAGYGDGEACLLFSILQDKRPGSINTGEVSGWNIIPIWSLQSYDKDVLEKINIFLTI